MSEPLTLDVIREAVRGRAAAFRAITRLEPTGGPSDKVFPPTYEGGKYATETRRISSQDIECVVLDSVQSQANRMEMALQRARDEKRIKVPVIEVDFSSARIAGISRITSLEAPHRIADAILRASELDGIEFRKSTAGRNLDSISVSDATALLELCPTALIFGMWDSGPQQRGLGAKLSRAFVSEVIGVNYRMGRKSSSRIDPLPIRSNAAVLYRTAEGDWTLDESEAMKEKKAPVRFGGKEAKGRPAEALLGNVTPTLEDGGVTIDYAQQTAVLSLPALRRLRFPTNGASRPDADATAHEALAALALCAATFNFEEGFDLRSRCALWPTQPLEWALLDRPAEEPRRFRIDGDLAGANLEQAVAALREAGLPWREPPLVLQPSAKLVKLVQRSVALGTVEGGDGE